MLAEGKQRITHACCAPIEMLHRSPFPRQRRRRDRLAEKGVSDPGRVLLVVE